MTTHGQMLLRDLANAGESVRAALDRAGLDYCCNGGQSLERACVRAGVDPEAIEPALADVALRASDEWAHRGVTELLDYVVRTVHPRTKRLLDELAARAASLSKTDEPARALRGAIDQLVAHATLQMDEEERVLFARVRALADARKGRGPFPPTLRTMHDHRDRLREGHATTHEHLRHASALARAATGQLAAAVRMQLDMLARSLTEQIHLENNELVPRALDLEPNGRDAGA